MIRVIIIEDESLAVKRIKRLLRELTQEIEVVGIFNTISESIGFFANNDVHYDLVLIDIHLGDGSSFEIFEKVKVYKPLIFTTAYDQYALTAFKQFSIDYLLKPIQQVDLQQAFDKYESFTFEDNSTTMDEFIAALRQTEKGFQKRFTVQVGNKIRYVHTGDIRLFYAENKICFILMDDGKRYYINYTLGRLVEMLDPNDFYRINRKVILHVESIKELVPFSKSKILVKTDPVPDFEIFVSTDKIRKFKDWLNQ